ncbi:vWA domain-containing protein [Staphylococcus massiliensis]|uniref:vWA domain-containing protein n=1 Tax=Staphylococcus massiliensis TaxID=555791 RepID=UPI001EDCCA2E|nr:VWA domain-containing protein [Staphylococcus massiliensis]MCG3398584.1 VWA domain-containing protein [Staphylococcus massiliensis]MCG3401149.1 VWA domain-containing protein [Staphylococcus massiliensis]MCG3412285.1 VWA domain-containing protein [Staphylococcus massiliensis]
MSERFIKFNDEQLDAKKVMMLQDLARLLLKDPTTKVKIHKFPYYDPIHNELIASSFWSHRPENIEITGLKSDVLLATYSYLKMSVEITKEVLDNDFKHPKFYYQLFKLIEEIRVTQAIVNERPFADKIFQLRRDMRLKYNRSQIKVYQTKTTYTDLLFLYLEQSFLTGNFYDVPQMTDELDDILNAMYMYLPDIFQIESSEDSMFLADRIMFQIDDILKEDMLNEYYHLPRRVYEQMDTIDPGKRVDSDNSDGKNDQTNEEDETEEVDMKAEDSKSSGGSYMEMELNEGENSDASTSNDDTREGDSTDDITEMATKKGKGTNDDVLDDEEGGQLGMNPGLKLKGINENVEIKWNTPSIEPEFYESYREVEEHVQFEIKDLIQMIKKTIEREQQSERHNLTKGRLQKNLINWFIDNQYKMFYKKEDLSHEFDATFTLLIDASASMHDKMDETIKGVVLFHETLKHLNIKHEILAFNEDAFDADDRKQPNIIDEIISFHQSVTNKDDLRIMALEPQDDNRDGVAIRLASDRLLRRSHKQKFLIVFSDGEPSAYNYSQDGILDTYEAVETSRKLGIEVFNVFLSQDPITEDIEETIHNIYGPYAIFVEGVEHLPEHLSPLLKKLLLQTF